MNKNRGLPICEGEKHGPAAASNKESSWRRRSDKLRRREAQVRKEKRSNGHNGRVLIWDSELLPLCVLLTFIVYCPPGAGRGNR